MIAHIAGVPFEETLLQLTPAGLAGLLALRAAWARMLRRRRAQVEGGLVDELR